MNNLFSKWFDTNINQKPLIHEGFFYPDMDSDGLCVDVMEATLEYLRNIGEL